MVIGNVRDLHAIGEKIESKYLRLSYQVDACEQINGFSLDLIIQLGKALSL